MGTTSKALRLLDFFTPSQPAIGLSDLARQSGMDKASTFRLLSELRILGFVEQNAKTKLFRLGPAVIRLANVREQTFPLRSAAQDVLLTVVEAVRETAHVTQRQGLHLSPIHKLHSNHHSTYARIDPTQLLPLHATASGCAVLAFSVEDVLKSALASDLPALTHQTLTDETALRAKISAARDIGFGVSSGEFETETCSIAAPYFGASDQCVGAISVVFPSSRKTDDLTLSIRHALIPASIALTNACGGQIPAHLIKAWGKGKGA